MFVPEIMARADWAWTKGCTDICVGDASIHVKWFKGRTHELLKVCAFLKRQVLGRSFLLCDWEEPVATVRVVPGGTHEKRTLRRLPKSYWHVTHPFKQRVKTLTHSRAFSELATIN